MAFVAAGVGVAEILHHIGGPLVRLCQQHPAGEFVVDHLAAVFEEGVRLRKVLAVGALAFKQIGHRVQPKSVDAEIEPEPQHVDHRFLDGRIVVVEVGLVGEEPVPVELLAHRIEGPVRLLGVDEDDPGVAVALTGVAPHEIVAVWAVGVAPRLLEPLVGVGRVVHHQVGDHADAAAVGRVEQRDEIVDGAEFRQDLVEVPDVVATVAQRRVVERRQPETVDAKPFQIVELLDQTAQVARTIGAAVVERPHQHLVEHRALEPGAVFGKHGGMVEVVGGRMFDHAAFDVAALRGIVVDQFVDTASSHPSTFKPTHPRRN